MARNKRARSARGPDSPCSSESTKKKRSICEKKAEALATVTEEKGCEKTEYEKQEALGAQSLRGGVQLHSLNTLGSCTHAREAFQEMLEREQTMAGDWAVFYHSYNTPELIYQVQSVVAKVLFGFHAEEGVLPRLLMAPYGSLPDVDAVLAAFPSWPDHDHNPAFKRVGICCSTSLLSSDPEATPTQFWNQGYGASTVGMEVLERFLQECAAPEPSALAKQLLEVATGAFPLCLDRTYGSKRHGAATPRKGHLLQIFIKRSCVDKWAYASAPGGSLESRRHPLGQHLASEGVIRGQARLIVNPLAFMNSNLVRLHSYSADEKYQEQRPELQAALQSILHPVFSSGQARENAVRGICGGTVPTWWKDPQSEPPTDVALSVEDTGAPEQTSQLQLAVEAK